MEIRSLVNFSVLDRDKWEREETVNKASREKKKKSFTWCNHCSFDEGLKGGEPQALRRRGGLSGRLLK